MNQARALHEATQLALKGNKVLVSCPCVDPELSERLIEGVSTSFLLYDSPIHCTSEPNGPGWAVRFRSGGEVFFSPFYSTEDHYFDYMLTLVSVDEIQSEMVAKGMPPSPVPLQWHPVISLVREPVYVPTRYERIMARW